MGKIMEAAFCAVYLVVASIIGMVILVKGRGAKASRLFGVMTLVLAGGDAFHLLPRITGALSGVPDAAALGFGMLVTSFTMTVFYVLLFYFITTLVSIKNHTLWRTIVIILAVVRIALLCFPQNEWLSADAPVSWGIYRNIPFVVLGAADTVLLFRYLREDRFFRSAWLAVALSFAFYIPVVLFAKILPAAGMFMMPKTVCYVWLMILGHRYAA
jgi:hypothetical protein